MTLIHIYIYILKNYNVYTTYVSLSPPFSLCHLSLSSLSLSLSFFTLSSSSPPLSLSAALTILSPFSPFYHCHTRYLSLCFSLLPDTYLLLSLTTPREFLLLCNNPCPPPTSIFHLISICFRLPSSIYLRSILQSPTSMFFSTSTLMPDVTRV